MSAFAAMRQTLVADPNLGVDARYTPPSPPGGSATDLRVLVRDDDEVPTLMGSKAVARRVIAEASTVDLVAPLEGGTLLLIESGETFRVKAPRYTDDRRGWILPLQKT